MFGLCSYQTKIKLIQYHGQCKSWSCVSACNTTMHCKIQYCLSVFNISCINYVTCCLRTQSSWCFLCFEFRHFTKQNLILLNIINLIIAQFVGYFIHLLSLLLQDGDIVSNPRVKNKKVNNLVTGMSIVHRLKSFLKLKLTIFSIVMILSAYQKLTLLLEITLIRR